MKTTPLVAPDPAMRRDLDDVARQFLITVGDVVALTGRPPWAVAQWRKRVADPFPDPVEGGRTPQFNAAQVLAWLRHQKDPQQGSLPADEPQLAWFWQHAAALLPAATTPAQRRHLRVYVSALVALGAALRHESHLSPKATGRVIGATSDDLLAQAAKVERRRRELRGLLVPHLALVTPEPEVMSALTLTLDHALRTSTGGGGGVGVVAAGLLDDALRTLAELAATAPTTHPLVGDITGAIARHWPATRVLDPACGEGVLLAELSTGRQDLELVGVELDEAAATTARLRLGLRSADAEVRQADALTADDLREGAFDIVVLDPPTGDLGPWVDLMTDALTADGRAMVAMRATSLRGSAKGLVARRQTAAVVLLPPTVRHGGRDTQALTVISQAAGRDTILVIDLSHLRPPVLADDQSNEIGILVNRWLAKPELSENDRAAFSAQTNIQTCLVDARRAERTSLVDLIEPDPEMASDAEVRAAAAHLDHTLSKSHGIDGTGELRSALATFTRINRRKAAR